MTPLINYSITVQTLHVSVLDLLLTFLILVFDISILCFELCIFEKKLLNEFLNGVAHNCRFISHREVLTRNVPKQLCTRGPRGLLRGIICIPIFLLIAEGGLVMLLREVVV